jgi:hypothetical protein
MEKQWLTTAPAAGAPLLGNAGRRGWKVHAVEVNEGETFRDVRARRAACGLLPAHGWDMDPYVIDRCKRCDAALSQARGEG